MTDAKSAWNDAGDRLQSLGASLKQHYAAQRGDDAGQTKEQVSDAFKKVGDALQGAFDALGAAAKDPAVKEDVRATGKSVADALGQTFTSLSDEVKKAFDTRKGDAGNEGQEPAPAQHWDPPATSPSTAAPAGAQDSGVDGGTAPRPASSPEPPTATPQDKQDPTANI